jgi:ribonuclease Z
VGGDTGCTVPSVLLFFDRQRYLFNAGEGFQRFCVEHRIKLNKLSAVLATRVATEATGGVPGMLLTIADASAGGLLAGHSSVMGLHGPRGMRSMVNAFRTFVNARDMDLKVDEFNSSTPVIANELVTITPVVLEPEEGGAQAPDDSSAAAAAAPLEPEPEAKRPRLDLGPSSAGADIPAVSREAPAACYICELADIPGKFLPQKAASMGVQRGPLYGKLVRGETVQGANGRAVRPEDVMEAASPGPVVLVLDCPGEAFMGALAAAPGLERFRGQGEAVGKGKPVLFVGLLFHTSFYLLLFLACFFFVF